jgi:hypothetical protein
LNLFNLIWGKTVGHLGRRSVRYLSRLWGFGLHGIILRQQSLVKKRGSPSSNEVILALAPSTSASFTTLCNVKLFILALQLLHLNTSSLTDE